MGFGNGTFVAYDKDGKPRSGRDPIDLEELFSHLTENDDLDAPMPEQTRMGHVHLHVADVDDALRFYHGLVGFDVMGHIPGVGFVSAGGYHHHLGLNEWAGRGARPAPAGSAGRPPLFPRPSPPPPPPQMVGRPPPRPPPPPP